MVKRDIILNLSSQIKGYIFIIIAEPLVATLLAFLFWDKVLNPISYIGGALILCSVILTISIQES